MKSIIGIIVFCLLCIPTIKSQEFNDLVFSGFVEFTGEQNIICFYIIHISFRSIHTDENIDFSKIEVLLVTEDNKIVEKTHCSSNGFYLLPIYDKKSYVIKVKPTPETKFGRNISFILEYY